MIKEFRDDLAFKKDDIAAVRIAGEILNKSTKLDSTEYPEKHRSEIVRNLKKASTKIEKIISKLVK